MHVVPFVAPRSLLFVSVFNYWSSLFFERDPHSWFKIPQPERGGVVVCLPVIRPCPAYVSDAERRDNFLRRNIPMATRAPPSRPNVAGSGVAPKFPWTVVDPTSAPELGATILVWEVIWKNVEPKLPVVAPVVPGPN